MNNKGVTLIELLIVIVVMGIIAAFSMVAVVTIIENTKEDSFLNTANTMIRSGKNAYDQTHPLWDDSIATLQELIDSDFIEVSENDPWGQPYDTTNSFVQLEEIIVYQSSELLLSLSNMFATNTLFKVKLVSPTATIGFDVPLAEFDNSDVIYLTGGGGSVIDGIIESITGQLKSAISGDNNNDQITTDNKIGKGGSINIFAGNDIISVGGEMSNDALIDSGTGNDTITLDGPMKGAATIDSGDGDDTITVPEIRYLINIYAGAGDDTVTINSVTTNFQKVVDMGSGNDTLTLKASGLAISNISSKTVHFIGGTGDDILNLPNVDALTWADISSMFSGFETINLSDTTITN
ncbi:MAG: type II secretion system GspH family protein [Firmicutes bacterium]|nr:type II secretion system GspH family protein [Bacillota bacterium]